MVFFDSSGGMEEYNLRVFLMVTHSFVGALPLGIIVTSDETTDTLTRALELFSSSLPGNLYVLGFGHKFDPKKWLFSSKKNIFLFKRFFSHKYPYH